MSHPIATVGQPLPGPLDTRANSRSPQRKSPSFGALLGLERGALAPSQRGRGGEIVVRCPPPGTCGTGATGQRSLLLVSGAGGRLSDENPASDAALRAGLDDLQGVPGGEWGDPLARALAVAVFPAQPPPADAGLDLARSLSVNATFGPWLSGAERLLRRIGWGGDRNRGAARLEFGSGVLAGSTLLIEADRGSLSLTLEVPVGAASEAWVERLGERLRGRGLQIDEFLVR